MTERNEAGGAQAEMSFWDHLEVLRRVIFRVLAVFAVLFAVILWLMPHIFTAVILAPASDDFFIYRFLRGASADMFGGIRTLQVQIINIDLAAQFLTHINMSMLMAAVITFPYCVYELWFYVRPALYTNEIRAVRKAFTGGTIMFYLGCLVGYALVFPFTFRFLAGYQLSPEIVNQINLQSYINYFIMLILIMGIVFEMPLVAWLLSRLGLLNRKLLKKYRRHAVVILLVLAAVITPSGDPFTLAIAFLPLYLLYELSLLVVRKEPSAEA